MLEQIQETWGRFKIWAWHRFLCDHCRYMRKHVKDLGRGDYTPPDGTGTPHDVTAQPEQGRDTR